jgi:integrase
MAKTHGAGTIYQRGDTWWVQVWVDGKRIRQSSESTKKSDAVKLRDKLLGKRARGELSASIATRVLIGELLDDVLQSDIKASTKYIWEKVIEKSLRPFFGHMKAQRLATDHMDEYRAKRKAAGASDSTANRELSILRTALHNGRKRTPPKVLVVPYFPMVKETNIRKGFLSDEQYVALRDALPPELRALFVCGYFTGIRKSELLAIEWDAVDFEARIITLAQGETKNQSARTVPIAEGDMYDLLIAAKRERDESWPGVAPVFARGTAVIKDFRGAWDKACTAASVPELTFHDLRRTAVRNMRRDGIPQVVRMRISGHKTDSMERRYSIVDSEDLNMARELMGKRGGIVAVSRDSKQPGGTST